MTPRLAFAVSFSGVAVMAMAMAIGPAFSPAEFSWVAHSTSQQAGQHTPGAWIMRVGFVAYGLATLIAALLDLRRRPLVRGALVVFGAGLIAAAVWSNASILADVPSDMDEDRAHSIASAVVGAAFAAACGARLLAMRASGPDALAWAGLVISVAIPLAMTQLPEVQGLLQRSMFVFSFAVVLREFWPGDRNRR